MIVIGLSEAEKQKAVERYIQRHGIEKTIIFEPDVFPIRIHEDHRRVDYNDIIEYHVFYPLLEIIDSRTLLVFNECMRTRKRSELTYNCAHHYCNQTPHKIVLEYFPFIEDRTDFMILLDLIDKGRYKGKSFHWEFLAEQSVYVRPRIPVIECIPVSVSIKDIDRHRKQRDSLFATLGEKDPDTIPRALHLFTGTLKKPSIDPNGIYVARNQRLALQNVVTYKDVRQDTEYTVVDFPHQRIRFNDFLKTTEQHTVSFISTGLPVDSWYFNSFVMWLEELEEFYAKTSLHGQDRVGSSEEPHQLRLF